jgi:carboxypeptidase C (cathepsin A)
MLPRFLEPLIPVLLLPAALAAQAQTAAPGATPGATQSPAPAAAQGAPPQLAATATTSSGSVRTASGVVSYTAVAGTLLVHPKGWDDAAQPDASQPTPLATMSYVYYFKSGADAAERPLTFLFNGGPGSATLWLHIGAFGPRRVVTDEHRHAPGAPYEIVENDQSLLDASDLVFVDMPGTGFGRITGKDKEKAQAFYGVDQDIHAFAVFIRDFLTKYRRWNSPKYVFGESYGTLRGAGLTLALQNESIDLNGVMLLSCILNWDTMPDDPQLNPSIDEPYIVSLPTYAATAWYHHKLKATPPELASFLAEVEAFATNEYALALLQGNRLPDAQRQAIVARLHDYTSLSAAYLLKSNLRIAYGAFQKELLGEQALTTGTLDTRFTGPTLDPLSKLSGYDPQGSAIDAAYVAAFETYVAQSLRYESPFAYRFGVDVYKSWDYKHQAPGAGRPLIALPNVLPDLATAMKRNPTLKLLVLGGYYDVSTPYFEGRFELRHLPIPAALEKNIEYRYYESGHMVYLNLPALKQLHDDVAAFIRGSSGPGQ